MKFKKGDRVVLSDVDGYAEFLAANGVTKQIITENLSGVLTVYFVSELDSDGVTPCVAADDPWPFVIPEKFVSRATND